MSRGPFVRSAHPLWSLLSLALVFAGSFAASYCLVPAARSVPGPGVRPQGDMAWIPAGEFLMGTDSSWGRPEEKPAHRVRVDGFWIDRTPVTNADFARFVTETGYVTTAEIAPDPRDYPGALADQLSPASLVFTPPGRPVDLRDVQSWWVFLKGASWARPYGPESTTEGLDDHPVVHVAWRDVVAYAAWADGEIPTEAEWEYAARGGLDAAEFAWGDTFAPDGRHQANTWQGAFPNENLAGDGFERTSPVGAFPPNGYGLVDMIGNVWEWTQDWYTARHDVQSPCCAVPNPRGGSENESYDPHQPVIRIPRKVVKGGSHLCAPNYCRRYRPAARHPQPVDTSMSHVGFRLVSHTPAPVRT